MPKTIKEVLTDYSGVTSIEYSDGSTRSYTVDNVATISADGQSLVGGASGLDVLGVTRRTLAHFSGYASCVKSGTGNTITFARIPLGSASNIAGAILEFSGLFEKQGASGYWSLNFEVVNKGGAIGSGTTVLTASPAPTNTQLRFEFFASLGIDKARKNVIVGRQDISNTGYVFGTATTQSSSYSIDFSVDKDLLIHSSPANGDEVVMRRLLAQISFPPRIPNDPFMSVVKCAGDSLTFGTGSNVTKSYPCQLSSAITRPVENCGVGGETAAQIAARVIAIPADYQRIHIFQMGRNNVGTATLTADVLAALDSCVKAIGHTKFLIGSVTPMTTETIGTQNRTAIIACNAAIAAAYPSNYVDTLTALATNAGEIPASSYSDTTHFNDAGYLILATTYATAINARGW